MPLLLAPALLLGQAGLRSSWAAESGTSNAAAATAQSTPSSAPSQPSPSPQASGVIIVRADQQGYDQQLGRFVASGNVQAELNGWRLLADRLELAEASRSVYASGRVRLFKGDQYLQASRLRYSDWEASGELDDVYGVIDQDTLATDANGAALSQGDPPAFVCPPLSSDPRQKPLLRLTPPGRTSQPTIAAPPGCPGSELSRTVLPLSRALEAVAFGAPHATGRAASREASAANPAGTTRDQPETIDSRVSNVTFQQSWGTSLKLDLAAVIDSTDSLNSNGARYLKGYGPPRTPRGSISRIRFQGSQIRIQGNRWTAERMAFTNDPFTPANSWSLADKVVAVMDERGATRINSRSTQILLDGKISLPAVTNATIGAEDARLVFDTDKQDRDGFYIGYNLEPIKLGRSGSLQLQPQLMVQRAIEGRTSSFIAPGQSLGSPTTNQAASLGDMFGLLAALNLPMGWVGLNSDLSLSSLEPEHVRSGTRARTRLTAPLQLAGHSSADAGLFGSYRERIYNGSLGLQTVVYSYGAKLAGNVVLNKPSQQLPPATQTDSRSGGVGISKASRSPFFTPINLNWAAQTGNYQATLFQTTTLDTLWRSYANIALSSSLRFWEGSALDSRNDPGRGLRYSPSPVVPGFGLDLGASGYLASYSDGASQNTLTLWGGPSFTLGRFDKPMFDYTRFSAAIAGTFLGGGSPFGFDRAVDLRTISFQAAQQIYGPLVLEAGATFNIDSDSAYYGDVSYSYVELKLQRRSYEVGVYYSPYDGIGGIRVKLNDFNFTGPGSPFVPWPRNR